jgi:alpha-N-arabinofuranosidase
LTIIITNARKNFNDVAHYDKTDRNRPKIFVGVATLEGRHAQFWSRTGDAAWMTRMERNSDIMILAPLPL